MPQGSDKCKTVKQGTERHKKSRRAADGEIVPAPSGSRDLPVAGVGTFLIGCRLHAGYLKLSQKLLTSSSLYLITSLSTVKTAQYIIGRGPSEVEKIYCCHSLQVGGVAQSLFASPPLWASVEQG
ncbi:hypothetical protein NPIL_213871 [Nephila pilipes]|uniref:Uncharacterized protein n=1 Tax=Nephila pilipes TaxID=299642 RepID=A0A8X6P7A6_NEPPI|nr:hypothetical protein NPIL_213871 [Nephila pilipes]